MDDPITKKIKARQAIIDKLRLATGEKYKLSQELAHRLEQSDLYHQRQVIKKFVADHAADPRALRIVKEHLPQLAPITTNPAREPAQELPERLRQADRYVEPTPTKENDYQLPGM